MLFEYKFQQVTGGSIAMCCLTQVCFSDKIYIHAHMCNAVTVVGGLIQSNPNWLV